MQIRHTGYRISGVYRVARIGQVNDQAQFRLNALRFWEDHGIAAGDNLRGPLTWCARYATCTLATPTSANCLCRPGSDTITVITAHSHNS